MNRVIFIFSLLLFTQCRYQKKWVPIVGVDMNGKEFTRHAPMAVSQMLVSDTINSFQDQVLQAISESKTTTKDWALEGVKVGFTVYFNQNFQIIQFSESVTYGFLFEQID